MLPSIKTFTEVTKKVHSINDLILSDMTGGNIDPDEENIMFGKYLLAVRYWYGRISWANKKRYILALLNGVQSSWTLSLLLKSIWNCRPKDSVDSVSVPYEFWSSFDQVPVDHNRTAIPVKTLAKLMANDRRWFLSLEAEAQAVVITELLSVSGGPIMWEVLRRAQIMYERYRTNQLHDLEECSLKAEKRMVVSSTDVKGKQRRSSACSTSKSAAAGAPEAKLETEQVQKELEQTLATWNDTIKSLRDALKLEELEMTFSDGTTKKIWKVNRQVPEVFETVDFLQLLPSWIGKRILHLLPLAQLPDYAKVNRYWAFLVEELKAELAVRQKIDTEMERLQNIILSHDTSLDVVQPMLQTNRLSSINVSTMPSSFRRPPSFRNSEKSAETRSFQRFLSKKMLNKITINRPLRNVAELTERLHMRGAADENLWRWCRLILKYHKRVNKLGEPDATEQGIIPIRNSLFPCPMALQKIQVPMDPPLYYDPTARMIPKVKKNISNSKLEHVPKEETTKRFSLWSRDFSTLYSAFKIPAYQSPV